MTRTLELSEDGAEAFVLAMLQDDLINITLQLSDNETWHHPDDKKTNKKVAKALEKLIDYYGGNCV